MPGPKPRAPRLRVIGGRSPGRDSGGRRVPKPPAFVRHAPSAPTWLSAEAKAEWRRVVPQLDRLKLLKLEDRAALAIYCETWSTFVRATRLVAKEGLTTNAKQGVLSHPAGGIARAASRELRAWCAEFGFSPSAEGRLAVTGAIDTPEDFD